MSDNRLARRLSLPDAVVIGLGAMIGAGVFAAFAPAAAAAGRWLLVALALAALVAYCNAISSARLATRYPLSGGTYVYGRERLGPFWGYLAGWSFVVGKTASCAAMALTFAAYAVPGFERPAAVLVVLAVTALNWHGVQRSVTATRIIVAVVLAVLVAVVVAGLVGATGTPGPAGVFGSGPFPTLGVLQAAGLLFFAFAGYARVATLGEEVTDPARTIPRAIVGALGVTLAVYTAIAVTLLVVLGPERTATATAPLAEAVTVAGAHWLVPVVRVGAALAAAGALLALVLGVSRTAFAMARDRHLPAALDAVHPRHGVPHRAELAVGLVVAVVVALVDVRGAIGFSSFGVLLYYAVANASAWTLGRRRLVPAVGLAGCLVLAAALPLSSVLTGAAVVAAGALIYLVRRARR
ncbi:APC family permease [Polymorphospora rubra]|uniref:Putative transporter n=1 Tax=Polymorphospora rubra TaxID=338584 RepID=A0A810N7V7_9ACTN|nr:amino acid permease [Polymorphospora rubra]BCJ67485.1 putative transporter [Polymorphospora rubra]